MCHHAIGKVGRHQHRNTNSSSASAGTTGLAIARSLFSQAATCSSSKSETEDYVTRGDGGFLVRGLLTAALRVVATGGSKVIKPELGCEADQVLARDARRPLLWARHVGETLRCLGCTETKGASGVHYQKANDVGITFHEDDSMVVGEEELLLELKAALIEVYKLKLKVLGPDKGDSKEGVYLERRLQRCDWGIERATRSTSRSLQICERADDSGGLRRRRFQEDRLPAQRNN